MKTKEILLIFAGVTAAFIGYKVYKNFKAGQAGGKAGESGSGAGGGTGGGGPMGGPGSLPPNLRPGYIEPIVANTVVVKKPVLPSAIKAVAVAPVAYKAPVLAVRTPAPTNTGGNPPVNTGGAAPPAHMFSASGWTQARWSL
ncbi:MAG: hypothetical protein UV51_C0007G0032 [Candidatus Woesebacteria bacterium GW2011_GWC1_42_9]|nr:MAG: hypothetical protein UV51_C0007G0032 [Candidatus Woesebacteria bacterium GW2011_GWC1_42_9]